MPLVYPGGAGWNVAPVNSSKRTKRPTVNNEPSATVTENAPRTPSAVKYELPVLLSSGPENIPGPMTSIGQVLSLKAGSSALLLGMNMDVPLTNVPERTDVCPVPLRNMVTPAPEPRRVTLFCKMNKGPGLCVTGSQFITNVPAFSKTTLFCALTSLNAF